MASAHESAEMHRLKSKLSVELLWLYVLRLLKEKPLHGYAIRKAIEQQFGFLPGNVTAYVVLYKLKLRDFVKAEQHGNKTVYSITARGKRLFGEGKKEWHKHSRQLFS